MPVGLIKVLIEIIQDTGSVVRTFASHQRGPGLSGAGLCSEGSFSVFSGYTSCTKPTLLNSKSIWTGTKSVLSVTCATVNLFICLFICRALRYIALWKDYVLCLQPISRALWLANYAGLFSEMPTSRLRAWKKKATSYIINNLLTSSVWSLYENIKLRPWNFIVKTLFQVSKYSRTCI